jgi:tetratricopeptide (TPR) repeat protein
MRRLVAPKVAFLSLGFLLIVCCSPYQKGLMQAERHAYPAAIESFQQELIRHPEHWQARQQLGYAYLKTGQKAQAIQEFQRVLADRPGEPLSTYYLGLAYLEEGHRSQALETWKSYRNDQNSFSELELKRQMTLVEFYDSIHLARQALAEEQKLQAVQPQSSSVAVFYFKDLSADHRFRHLQKAMATLIITDLSQVKSLRVMERLKVQCLLSEMQLGETGIVDASTAPRTGRLLGAENLIVGSLESGSMIARTTVASTQKQDVIAAFYVRSESDKFFTVEKMIVSNLVKVLKVPLTPEEEARLAVHQTQNLKAVIFFGQGLEALDAGKWEQAHKSFSDAATEDPGFELAKRYRDGCPAASSASIAGLAAMSNAALSDSVAAQMDASFGGTGPAASQTSSGAGGSDPGAAPAPAPGPTGGNVGVVW